VEAFCIQEDDATFKKSIIDPSWSHAEAPNETKADNISDPK
jgi:hypothetical protein